MYYDILKASKVKAEVFPDYWTQLWGRKLSASMIKTITGVLPLTFTAKGGAVSDWVIYGNDDNGTENLFDIESVNAITDLNDNKGLAFTQPGYYLVKSYSNTNGYFYGRVYENGTAVGSYYYIKAQASLTTAQITLSQGQTLYLYDPLSANLSLTEAKDQIATYKIYVEYSSTVMPIAPDHYIPYQQGVGQKTANFFDISKVTDRVAGGHTFLQVINNEIHIDLTASTSTPDGDNHTLRDLVGELELNTEYTLKATTTGLNQFIYLSGTGANYAWAFGNSKTFATQESLNAALDARVLWYASGANTTAVISNIMLVKGNTAPTTYIPHGYEIPISCEHSVVGEIKAGYYDTSGFHAQTVWSVIRATTEPKYLSSGSYKVNIPSFVNAALIKRIVDEKEASASFISGDSLNITTAGTYTVQINTNDPMSNAQLQEIDRAMLLADGDNYTFYIGSSPLTAGQSISKTSTGVDLELSEGENTVSTTLYNKPKVEIKYK